MVGFGFSAAIEMFQVLLDRGLGELDDVLHNTWGSLMGYCAAVILGYLFGQHKERYDRKVKGAGLFFGMTILMFTILILYNKPDWGVRLWRR
ncbi:MAG: VanZ family protein [Clostridia bacterium]|nr:VanZ family protein [Clostridia bacterium]